MEPDDLLCSRNARPQEEMAEDACLVFHCAVILLEDGAEEFSHSAGIEHIRFRKESIQESFGDVLAALSRVFG